MKTKLLTDIIYNCEYKNNSYITKEYTNILK